MLHDEEKPIFDLDEELSMYRHLVNIPALKAELKGWYIYKKSVGKLDLNSTISSLKEFMVKPKVSISHPQIFKLMKIYLTIPVTSAGAERSFSVLKRLKNCLRTTMGQKRLSSLAILEIECKTTTKNYK